MKRKKAKRRGVCEPLRFISISRFLIQDLLNPPHLSVFQSYLDPVGMGGGFGQDLSHHATSPPPRPLIRLQHNIHSLTWPDLTPFSSVDSIHLPDLQMRRGRRPTGPATDYLRHPFTFQKTSDSPQLYSSGSFKDGSGLSGS